MSSIFVQVKGVSGVQKMLRPWLEPELDKQLDAATKKSAQFLAKQLRSELRPISKHMARAVRVKRARRDKPAWVVGSRRKTPPGAFWWHMVIGGTKDHGPRKAAALVFVPGWNPYLGASSHGVGNGWVRASRVRGVKPNPLVKRVADRYGAQAYDILGQALLKA